MNGPEFLDVLLARFPKLANTHFEITSPASDSYNCLAWAAGDSARWWWPDALETSYWPPGVLRQATVECFVDAYRTLGYEVCATTLLDTNVEKLAIYAKGGRPTHIARQLRSGDWTSKLGASVDIRHELPGLEGTLYGTVCAILGRGIRQ